MHPYDEANEIISRHLPALATANGILGRAFPSAAEGNRIAAGFGLPFRSGAYLPPKSGGELTPGTAGGLVSRGGPGGRPTRRGPLRTEGPRSPAGQIVKEDVGGTVNINVWAGLLQRNGISAEAIRSAYEAAGGSADLAAEQRAGDTSDFRADFVQALEELGADPAVLLGTYQQAGGLRRG